MSVESVSTGIGSKSRLRLPKKTTLGRYKGTESIASSVASNLNRWVEEFGGLSRRHVAEL